MKALNYELTESGITMIETLVAILLNSIIIMMLVASALSNRQLYLDDIVRVRVAGNLRTATDIMSMNIKQLGENLSPSFPAITVVNGTSGASDVLTIRRAVLNEVLTLCVTAAENSTRIYVSDAAAAVPQCVASSIDDMHAKFETYRTAHSEDAKLYIYNSLTKLGEFLEFDSSGTAASEYYFDVSNLAEEYPALNSNIYILEEFIFQQNESSKTLIVYKDGANTEPLSIAFAVTDLSVLLKLKDGSTISALDESDSTSWKDIKLVNVELSGEEEKFKGIVSYTTNQDIFPRNIMSLDNGSA